MPTLDKYDSSCSKLWSRRFTQYIKMTRDIDSKVITTEEEIIEEFREQLEIEIKVTFVWTLGESAIMEMTKTVSEKEPTSLPLNRLYTLLSIYFIPERNKHHSRAECFNIKREEEESAGEVWKRILE